MSRPLVGKTSVFLFSFRAQVLSWRSQHLWTDRSPGGRGGFKDRFYCSANCVGCQLLFPWVGVRN